MEICIVLGTRPEIIKLSPIFKELENRSISYFVIHTNQHYSKELDKLFFDELELREPKYNLEVGSGTHGAQTGNALIGTEKILLKRQPDWVLVEGDTNSVLAGALAAAKLNIKVGHVEAGLRSGDKSMPEELNRILTDHLSDALFAPTEIANENLGNENIDKESIFITGNTIVDAVYSNASIAKSKSNVLERFEVNRDNFILLTLHRAENVDFKDRLDRIITGINEVGFESNLPIIYTIHPRTGKQLEKFGLKFSDKVRLVPPVSYLDFLQLQENAKCILTDSGGIQEEACILRVPCVTIRTTTERPETLDVGSNFLAGRDPEQIVKGYWEMVDKERNWENPFGDGNAAERIVDIITANERV
ncbi:UDP-N-acetylglucosamine 2-epimerase (non-hydrolyzing) [bacterium]|nr:UDP-N-acetylglucosamine 2-epimerase (non-hydrolyzing) [bacterium]